MADPSTQRVCPHCLVLVKCQLLGRQRFQAEKELLDIIVYGCPACTRALLFMITAPADESGSYKYGSWMLAWPQHATRPVPMEVPEHIAADYREAALVLNLSPKSSAALSRRCLQAVLRDAANANQRDLVQQIEAVLPHLPSYIAENIHSIRNIGNFAAHPTKNHTTGEIVEVEPGEAEWNLEVLDMLFDFYYVQPAQAKARRDALNIKLQAANKPPMK